jgi:hypothetical protein
MDDDDLKVLPKSSHLKYESIQNLQDVQKDADSNSVERKNSSQPFPQGVDSPLLIPHDDPLRRSDIVHRDSSGSSGKKRRKEKQRKAKKRDKN